MPDRKRYTAEEKAHALRLCDEVGVVKASEQTGISKFSLYKWRLGAEDEVSMPPVKGEEIPVEKVEVEGQATSPNREGRSAGKRYSAGKKAEALRLCNEIGLAKASKQTGITINSLRKWHMDAQNANIVTAADEIPNEKTATDQNESQANNASVSADVVVSLAKMQVGEPIADENVSEERIRLQLENTTLKAQIIALKAALRVFTE